MTVTMIFISYMMTAMATTTLKTIRTLAIADIRFIYDDDQRISKIMCEAKICKVRLIKIGEGM